MSESGGVRHLLSPEEERGLIEALRDLLRNKSGALGRLRHLAKRILDRLDKEEKQCLR
jgi:hypothetical protein